MNEIIKPSFPFSAAMTQARDSKSAVSYRDRAIPKVEKNKSPLSAESSEMELFNLLQQFTMSEKSHPDLKPLMLQALQVSPQGNRPIERTQEMIARIKFEGAKLGFYKLEVPAIHPAKVALPPKISVEKILDPKPIQESEDAFHPQTNEKLASSIEVISPAQASQENESSFEHFHLESTQNCDEFFRQSIHLFAEVYKERDKLGVTKHKFVIKNVEVDGYGSFRRNYVTLKMHLREIKSMILKGEPITDTELDRAQELYDRIVTYHDRVMAHGKEVLVTEEEAPVEERELSPIKKDIESEKAAAKAAIEQTLKKVQERITPALLAQQDTAVVAKISKLRGTLVRSVSHLDSRGMEQDPGLILENTKRTIATIGRYIKELEELLAQLTPLQLKVEPLSVTSVVPSVLTSPLVLTVQQMVPKEVAPIVEKVEVRPADAAISMIDATLLDLKEKLTPEKVTPEIMHLYAQIMQSRGQINSNRLVITRLGGFNNSTTPLFLKTIEGLIAADTIQVTELLAELKNASVAEIVIHPEVVKNVAHEHGSTDTIEKLPASFRPEDILSVKNDYRDALVHAIRLMQLTDSFTRTEQYASLKARALDSVMMTGDIYRTYRGEQEATMVRSGATKFKAPVSTEINKLESDLFKDEEKQMNSRIKKAIKVLALGIGLSVWADPLGNSTIPVETNAWTGVYTQEGQSSDSAISKISPEEIIPGVILPNMLSIQLPDSAPYSVQAEQFTANDVGVTFTYPIDHRLDIPVPTNDGRSVLTNEKPVVDTSAPQKNLDAISHFDASLAKGWGVNEPDVTFNTPVRIENVQLNNPDILPQLDREVPLPSHRFSKSEGLWQLVMGETEIGNIPALKGVSTETLRDKWRLLTNKVATDPLFRESLGAIYLTPSGEPRIKDNTDLKVNVVNEFFKSIDSQVIETTILPPVASTEADVISVRATAEVGVSDMETEIATVQVETIPAAASLEDAQTYLDQVEPDALADAVTAWVKKVEGVYSAQKTSILNVFHHHQKSPYEAMSSLSLRAIRNIATLKDLTALEHKLAELDTSAGGFGVLAAKVKSFLSHYGNTLGVSDMPLSKAAEYMYALETLDREKVIA